MPEAPRAELLRGLAVFAEAPGPSHAALADALGIPGVPDAAAYSDVFLFQLYPYAPVHLGPEGMMGGEARDRVAGFWRAVGRTPPPEPDHLAALLGLYAALLDLDRHVRGGAGGEARDRVAGFWRALGLMPPAEPDHLAALLGLYASLAEQLEGAASEGEKLLVDEDEAEPHV